MKAHGFHRSTAKHFVRRRGHLIDNVAFQLSQYGNKSFYIHRYTNLACSSKGSSILSSYFIGDRIDRSKYDDVSWIGDSETSADRAIKSVIKTCENEIFPWFSKYDSFETYVLDMAGHYCTSFEDLDFLFAVFLAGRFGKPYEKIKEMAKSDADHPDRHLLDRVWAAICEPGLDKEDRFRDILERIAVENLREAKIDQLFT